MLNYYQVEAFCSLATGSFSILILNVMVNAVLWLTGLCLCRTVLAESGPTYWNWKRKCLDPWNRWRGEDLNNTRASWSRESGWRPPLQDPYRRALGPSLRFYPYYTENPFKNRFPFLNPSPYDLGRVYPLEQPRRNVLGSVVGKSSRKKVQTTKDRRPEDPEDIGVSNVLTKDSCVRLSHNDTMVISPSILIGRKNDSFSNDDWILSNKPVNIYLDKLPDDGGVFEIVKDSVDASTPLVNKAARHKCVKCRSGYLNRSGGPNPHTRFELQASEPSPKNDDSQPSPNNRHSQPSPNNRDSPPSSSNRDSLQSPNNHDSQPSPNNRHSQPSPNNRHSQPSPNNHDSQPSPNNHDSQPSPNNRHSQPSPNNHDSQPSPNNRHSQPSPKTRDSDKTTQVSEEKWTTDSSSPRDNSDDFARSEKPILRPVKKRISRIRLPDVYSVDVGELIPDNDNSSRFYSPKPVNNCGKHRRAATSKKRRRASDSKPFKRFYYFPKLKRFSKRSLSEHKQSKRTAPSADPDDYLGVDYYDYGADDDDSYPDGDYGQDVFFADYAYVDPTFTTAVISTKKSLANYSFELDNASAVIGEKSTLSDVCYSDRLTDQTDRIDYVEPERNVPKVKYVAVIPSVVVRTNDHREPSNEPGDENDVAAEPSETKKPRSTSCIIKNLTDELEKRMAVLDHLCLDDVHENKTYYSKAKKSSLRTCAVLSSTSRALETSAKRPLCNFDVSYDNELPLFDSMFVSPNKASCERANSCRCVCSPDAMIDYFSHQLQRGNDAKVVLKKLITYSCEVYAPIETEYQIAADMKPRLISKKKRELIESENGPREISPVSFDELMMRGIPKQGVDFLVFPSTTVEIPCFTSDEMKLSPNIADSALYRWSHSNLKAITEGRILEDSNHKGSLIIQDVTLSDSDNYTCSVKYVDPDSQRTVKRTFVHAVKVVVLPRLALHTNLHYSASSLCDQELLEMFELYLPQQIERSICSMRTGVANSLCTVEIHNPVCYTRNKQDSMKRSIDPRLLWRTDFQKSRWIREILNEDVQEMEISLNYELDLKRVPKFVSESSNWSTCSPHCQQKLSLKTIEVLRDSFLDALLLPVKTKSVYFQPSLDSINIKLLTACDGGLELNQGFCIPCERHHYSEEGRTVCAPCPPGTYQDNIGAKSCQPCPHPFRPNCFYLNCMKNFTAFTFIVVGALAGLSFCWFGVIRIRKKVSEKKKERKKWPEPLPPDFD